MKAAGHDARPATVKDITTLDKDGRADVDVLVFPNRGFLPAEGEPGIFRFLAQGGVVIVGGSLVSTAGGPGGSLPEHTMDRVFRGELTPEQTRVPGGKWLRRTALNTWATPWRAYCLQVFPYVCQDFQVGLRYPSYVRPSVKDLPAGTALTPAPWLQPHGIPLRQRLTTKQRVDVLLPLTWCGRPRQARFVATPECRDNVYLGLYAPTPKKQDARAFGERSAGTTPSTRAAVAWTGNRCRSTTALWGAAWTRSSPVPLDRVALSVKAPPNTMSSVGANRSRRDLASRDAATPLGDPTAGRPGAWIARRLFWAY
jgi:hypothetical protein